MFIYVCLLGAPRLTFAKEYIFHSRRQQPPLWDQAHLAPYSGATCLRAKRRKTCSWHGLWKRSWLTRRWKRLTTHNCAKPARWHWVSCAGFDITFFFVCVWVSWTHWFKTRHAAPLLLINRRFCNAVAVFWQHSVFSTSLPASIVLRCYLSKGINKNRRGIWGSLETSPYKTRKWCRRGGCLQPMLRN